jgi:hypothetical protein
MAMSNDEAKLCLCGTGNACPIEKHQELLRNPVDHDDDAHGSSEECPDCIEGRHR